MAEQGQAGQTEGQETNTQTATWEEYRDEVWLCRAEVRKAQAQLKLNQQRTQRATERASPDAPTRKGSLEKVLLPLCPDKQCWKSYNR